MLCKAAPTKILFIGCRSFTFVSHVLNKFVVVVNP